MKINENLPEIIRELENEIAFYKSIADFTYDWELLMSPSGEFLYVSPSCERITGYKPEEFKSDPELFVKIVQDEHKELVLKHIRGKLSGEEIEEIIDFNIITKDGKTKCLQHACRKTYNQSGKLLGFRSSNRDITEMKAAQEKIYKLSAAVVQSPVSIMITDLSGNIQYVNPRFTKVTGYTSEEVIGKNPRMLKSDTKTPEEYKNLWSTILSGNTWEGEFLNRKKNGSDYWELATIAPIKNESDEIISLMAVKEDITLRKEMEKQLREANATKDKFFSVLAHDLKNPFQSIMGFSEMILSDIRSKDYEQLETYGELILKASRQAYNLLVNLLEWSRIQTNRMDYNPELLNVDSITGAILELSSGNINKKKLIVNKSIDHKLTLIADEFMITTVIRNLISNAIKFTPSGGKISITAGIKENQFVFTVADTGVGIKPGDEQKLFLIENNFSTQGTDNESGTGLGLILCKEFIKKHNGEIFVESVYGQGSVFTFNITIS